MISSKFQGHRNDILENCFNFLVSQIPLKHEEITLLEYLNDEIFNFFEEIHCFIISLEVRVESTHIEFLYYFHTSINHSGNVQSQFHDYFLNLGIRTIINKAIFLPSNKLLFNYNISYLDSTHAHKRVEFLKNYWKTNTNYIYHD